MWWVHAVTEHVAAESAEASGKRSTGDFQKPIRSYTPYEDTSIRPRYPFFLAGNQDFNCLRVPQPMSIHALFDSCQGVYVDSPCEKPWKDTRVWPREDAPAAVNAPMAKKESERGKKNREREKRHETTLPRQRSKTSHSPKRAGTVQASYLFLNIEWGRFFFPSFLQDDLQISLVSCFSFCTKLRTYFLMICVLSPPTLPPASLPLP